MYPYFLRLFSLFPHLDLRQGPAGAGVREDAQVQKLEGLGKFPLHHAQAQLLGEGHRRLDVSAVLVGVRRTAGRRDRARRFVSRGVAAASAALLGYDGGELEPPGEEPGEVGALLRRHLERVVMNGLCQSQR